MKYTVKSLAKVSGVSTRTLRYYDEIDLLKPAYTGENQYRYYEKEQLVRLQQILFFREPGFPLQKIKIILNSDEFDAMDALVENKRILREKIGKYNQFIETIDNTLLHLRGQLMMKDKDFYKGFEASHQAEYEARLIARGVSRDQIDDSWSKVSRLSKSEKEKLHKRCDEISKSLAEAIAKGLKPDDEEVQTMIKAHYDWICNYWEPNQASYIELSELYQEDNELGAYYKQFHLDMIPFLTEAMKVFAKKL